MTWAVQIIWTVGGPVVGSWFWCGVVRCARVDRFMAHYFTEVHTPPYPARHFDDTEEARTWLSTHLPAG
jgi:hypothetical protein